MLRKLLEIPVGLRHEWSNQFSIRFDHRQRFIPVRREMIAMEWIAFGVGNRRRSPDVHSPIDEFFYLDFVESRHLFRSFALLTVAIRLLWSWSAEETVEGPPEVSQLRHGCPFITSMAAWKHHPPHPKYMNATPSSTHVGADYSKRHSNRRTEQ
ncbi:MAG: hypothetical protein OEL20_04640 [Sulfuritalea sp.]|nr:hypothetical protein [Sulfuritalea sp.]